MYYTSKLLFIMTILTIARNRTTIDSVLLITLFHWSVDMGWVMHFFGCMNWFMRQLVNAQRVFNLEEIPQEKIEGKV